MKVSITEIKSYNFAKEIIYLYKKLIKENNEYVLGRQILKSGTAIGALIRESQFGQSKPDFINKYSIALKEANETDYWLNLLHDTNFISSTNFVQLSDLCKELIRLLTSSINTAKSNLKN